MTKVFPNNLDHQHRFENKTLSTQQPMDNTNSVEKFISFFKGLEAGEQNIYAVSV